ncbi:hypothetical protein Hanom_Chr11g00987741 [Helianthus anomalus]
MRMTASPGRRYWLTAHLTAKALSSERSTAMPMRRWAAVVGVSVGGGAVAGRMRGEEDLILMAAIGGRSDSGRVFDGCIVGLVRVCLLKVELKMGDWIVDICLRRDTPEFKHILFRANSFTSRGRNKQLFLRVKL